jgi:hypothetical protein
MKKYYFLTLSLLLTLWTNTSGQDIDLYAQPALTPIREAIDKGLIVCNVIGAYEPQRFSETIDGDGMYFGKCLLIVLKSKVDSLLFLKLESGLLMIPTEDTAVQTMLITHDVEFALHPRSSFISKFYAMCTEFHDAAPSIQVNFKIGKMADSNLVKLTKYIERMHLQNMIGQHAVWAITDQLSELDLIGYGADSISIQLTKDALNSTNLIARLNQEASINIPSTSNEKLEPDDSTTDRNMYIYYVSIAILFLLSLTFISISIRKKNVKNNNPPL